MKTPSLRGKALQVSIGAFVSATAIVLTTFVFVTYAKQNIAQKELQGELLKSGNVQVENIIPSLFIKEQQQGLSLLIDRFKKDEDLSEIQILKKNAVIPERFKSCKIAYETSVCTSSDHKEVAVLIPISESGKILDYLFKAKSSHSVVATKEMLRTLELFAVLLICVFAVVYVLISQLISKTLPTSLDNLIEWIEADLTGKKSHLDQLPFSELEVLREKISEALDRYHRERDQAIVGQLSSGVLHDMKTLIHPIKLSVDLASLAKTPEKYAAKCEYLHKLCEEQLPKIGLIIESVLDGNREIKVQLGHYSLLRTVQSAAKNTQDIAKQMNVQVELPIDDLIFYHDPAHLERAISNLLKNGIEAASESLFRKEVRVQLTQMEDNVSIQVEDSGPGLRIDPKKLFNSVKTTKEYGTGLGLIITRKIVEAHLGEIEVGSSSDLKGAKFVMTLKQGVNV
jgi:signal transduction histidine kinase